MLGIPFLFQYTAVINRHYRVVPIGILLKVR